MTTARARALCVSCSWLVVALAAGCRGPAPAPVAGQPPALSLAAILSDPSDTGAERDRAGGGGQYAHAFVARPFTFPADDGPHPEFRSEWWYFTGVLRARAADGRARRFGYELTIFRQALAPARTPRASAWATRDVFMGHLAITDIDGPRGARRFHAYERFARDGLALGGAQAHPFAAWVDDWRMQGPTTPLGASLPIRLDARADDGSAIALVVGESGDAGAGRGPIAQGQRGLSAKGPTPGNASFYYSRTRLVTRGRVTLPGNRAGDNGGAFEVTGLSWMDREWGTTALGAGVRGWDWLGVHLSDGRDLMLYRLRRADGQATAESRLALIDADGQTRGLGPQAFSFTPLAIWTSPRSGARYPTSFRLDVPGESLRLVGQAMLDDQELPLSVAYWEGAVSIAGTAGGVALDGEGYLELTGYDVGQRQD